MAIQARAVKFVRSTGDGYIAYLEKVGSSQSFQMISIFNVLLGYLPILMVFPSRLSNALVHLCIANDRFEMIEQKKKKKIIDFG